MKLKLEWGRPIVLKVGRGRTLEYRIKLSDLPDAPGVYVFGRRYGSRFEALYVGKAINVRRRIKTQLNNLRLMRHLDNAKAGKRVLLVGKFICGPGQPPKKAIAILERALIRHFLTEGRHDLVNMQGTRLRRHEIASDGRQPKRFIPRVMYLERGKGE